MPQKMHALSQFLFLSCSWSLISFVLDSSFECSHDYSVKLDTSLSISIRRRMSHKYNTLQSQISLYQTHLFINLWTVYHIIFLVVILSPSAIHNCLCVCLARLRTSAKLCVSWQVVRRQCVIILHKYSILHVFLPFAFNKYLCIAFDTVRGVRTWRTSKLGHWFICGGEVLDVVKQ